MGLKKSCEEEKNPSRDILIVTDNLLSDTTGNRIIGGKDLWSTWVWWSCSLSHIHPTAPGLGFDLYAMKQLSFGLWQPAWKTTFMFISCHICWIQLRNSSWNPICTNVIQLPIDRWDPLLGTIIFFRLCKSLSTYPFLHLVVPSEKA